MPIYSGKPCPGVDHRIPCRKIPFFQKLLFSPIQEIHRHNFARLFAGMPVVSGKAAAFRRNTLRQSDRGTGRISGYRHLYPSLPTERKMYPSAVPEAIRQLTHHRQSKSGQTRFCVCPLLIIIHQSASIRNTLQLSESISSNASSKVLPLCNRPKITAPTTGSNFGRMIFSSG